MSLNPEAKLKECADLYNKNLKFFKHKEPGLYALIDGARMSSAKVEVFEREDGSIGVDILEKGQFRYFGNAEHYSEKETEKFKTLMHEGLELSAFNVASVDSFYFDRLGSKSLKELAKIANEYTDVKNVYPIPNFYPLVVVTGIGLGLHIQNLINTCNINNLIVYEHSIDNFLASFYTLDWKSVYDHFDPDKGTSLQIIISPTSTFNDHVAHLWNELVCYCPQFPFTTYFYNHLSDEANRKIIERITSDLTVFLHQWGHYDDEINQFNNAQHNLRQGARVFAPSRFRISPDIPIAVVAGGPSLEERIESLRSVQDKILIISCGSAIGTLAHYNIKPDFHVELESDYLVYEAIGKVTSEEFRKGITLLGAAQLNPLAFTLFEKSLIFFKDSTALTQLFISNDGDIIRASTPTCTNAGISVAESFKTKKIYLFGADFGFYNTENHHASGSIHYEDNLPEAIEDDNDFEKNKLIEDISIKGTKIFTKPMYMTSKKRLEECIKNLHRSDRNVYNCSDGANIKNASWLDANAFENHISRVSVSKSESALVDNIYKACYEINKKSLLDKSTFLYQCIESIFRTLINRKIDINNMSDLSRYCFIINNIVTRHVKMKMGSIHFFVRGHVWIALSIIYTMSLNLKDEEVKLLFNRYQTWLENSSRLILEEMKSIMFEERDLSEDPWIHTTVEVEK